MLSLIAAVGLDGVIGNDGKLPWGTIKEDMQFFKRTTMGNTVVMGRKTFESLGSKPLKGRENIVITKDRSFKPDGVTVMHDPWEVAYIHDKKHVFIIGGSSLYYRFMEHAQYIFLTKIYHHFDGDIYFPLIDKEQWEIKRAVAINQNDNTPYDLSFLVYGRTYSH